MSLITKSTRAVLVGGALFALPLLLLILLAGKAVKLLVPAAKKIVEITGIHSLFGAATITVVSIAVILLICYISGKLLELGIVRRWSVGIEEKLLLYFPGYQMLKFHLMAENKTDHDSWQAILLQENTYYRVAFITDRSIPGFLCLFLPDAPRIDAGEVRYVRKEECKYHPITMQQAIRSLHRFGRELSFTDTIAAIDKVVDAK